MAAVRLFLTITITITFSLLTVPSLSIGEDVHLIEFKESMMDTSSLDATWVKGSNPCDRKKPWEGVDCSDSGYKSVSAILLMNRGLSASAGGIDIDALAQLEALRALSLENNSFSGPLPEINSLSSLRAIFLSGNHFSGEIPSNYFDKMGSLKKLHLQRNNFSGKIPDSIGRLANLMDLHLQNNQFSGAVPSLEQKSLQTADFSYNQLQGEIPQSMSRFQAKAFEGNSELCGSLVSKACPPHGTVSPPSPANDTNAGASGSSVTKWVILGVVVALLLITILYKSKQKEENFHVLAKENLDDVPQVQVPITTRRLSSTKRHGSYNYDSGSRSSKRGSSLKQLSGKASSSSDLIIINEEKGMFGLSDLMKAAAEVLGSGGIGSAYKAVMASGVSVVVKRMRDLNKLNKDGFETEIRRLGRIRHRNVLPPLAYHYRKEEKLLVTEFIPKGSLLYVLHGDRGIAHAELNWPTRLKIIKGVARGMGFLHTEFSNHEVPHGNLKSSNVLVSQNYEPLLTDYALYSFINNTQSVQALFAYKSPEAVLYQQITPKSDVFCLGIVILEVMTGKFPSQYLNNQKGGTDVVQWAKQAISERRVAELIDPEIANSANSLDQMEKMLCIGATCTENDQEKRVEMREAIRSIEEVQV